MSAVSEAVARRMTLGYLADTYGLELDPDFASGVTVTSIADSWATSPATSRAPRPTHSPFS